MKKSILKTSTPLLLLATYVYATTTNANDTIKNETRGPRVTGRIVKLYSGSRPEPIVCHGEGFQSDPTNCAVFYRCVGSSHGKFTVFRYQCGPGTIYDPETEICNHPKSTRRTECINFEARQNAINTEITNENDIDFAGTVEVPIPIRTVKPIYTEHTPVKRDDRTVSTKSPWIVSTQTQSTSPKWLRPTPAVSQKSSSQIGDTCISDGFMGDSENCRKFYRCVSNGRGGFIRYEFSCSESTMWDDEVEGCNHPSSVKRRRCGRGSDDQRDDAKESEKTVPKTYLPAKSIDSEAPTIQQQSQTNYGSKVSQIQIQINNGSNTIQNQTQLNYRDRVNQSQKQENYGSDSKQNQNQTSYGSAISQTQSQVNHGDKVVQTQSQIDHSKQSSQTQTQTSESVISDSTSTTSNNQEQSTEMQESQSNKCLSSGFKGDVKNCKKFYRCVDNGNGGYTQYEFSCGEGTVWDQSIEACNHPWAVNRCGNGPAAQSQESTTAESSTGTTTTQRTTETTQQATAEDEDDVGYGNQNQNQESSSTSSSSQSTSTITTQASTAAYTTTTEGHTAETVCNHNGFIGDDNDCKKFYRCVDNGNGGYTKYEYRCGEGTVWDPQITACNHAWAVEKCGGSAIDYNKETTTSKDSQETSTTTTTTTVRPTTESEDEDTGYGQTEATSNSTTNAPQPSQESSNDNVCQSTGFMGDSNDCNKFYRCVDNVNGGYTKYEFSCGEGTVWDQSIEACNHAWAVKDCKSQTPQTQTEAVTQQTSSTQTASSETGDNDQTLTSLTSSRPDTTSTINSENDPEPSEGCTMDGFIGDEKDCKKFYRCVDNGQGGFTKYEFTCGDGTVWDSEIQTCNHASRDNQCGSSQSSSSSTTEEPDRENDEMYAETTSTTTTKTTLSQTSSSEQPQSTSGTCQSEGFYENTDDCKKFYRCVDDGKGGYTKYDFVCGEGTVWDQEIQGCNHDNGNKNCKHSSSSSSDLTSQTTQEGSTEDNSVVTESGTTMKTSTTESSFSEEQCTPDGFYANPYDCKKFYRCVDNGKGGFTKYDFSCGDGTVWVQEIQACDHDNDVNSCSTQATATSSSEQHQTESTDQQPTSSSTTTTTQSIQQQTQADEYPEESSSSLNGHCTYEGFYPDEKDCRNFYRCVDDGNGGYTKYDFTCGEGTAWDADIQTCNHIAEVKGCDGSESTQEKPQSQESSSQSTMQDEQSGTTESSTTSTTSTTTTSTSGPCNDSSSESSSSSYPDQCTEEGYYGNSQDCKKFYRCVDNSNGGYTKYDFDCGEGTIWDQDITACNHPRDVNNPSCKNGQAPSSSSESSSTESNTESSSSQSTQSTSSQSTTTEKNNNQNSSDCNSSSQKPERSEVNCTKAGFYADPDDCKKFYRCVDWDGSGEKFSVFHFECGEGTIWDPAVDTCNHEDSVYPSRDCGGSQGQAGETNETTSTTTSTTESSNTTAQQSSTTTSEQTTTTEDSSKETTTEQPTTQEYTTSEQTTTQQSTTSEQTTTQHSTTSEQTTTQQSTTSEHTTTQQPTSEQTTEQSTTSEQTTTQSTTEKTTTQESTTIEQTTTEQSTTSEQTTQESTTSEQITQQPTTSEQTTKQESTTNEETTQQSTTSQQTTEESTTSEQTTTEESNTTEGTTLQSSEQTTTQQSTTQESTTENTTESSSEKECPETEEDQYLYVCPTGFRRHPKYCDMFYQCTENDDTHEVKVANFNCPNNTIYDESKTQCVEEDKAEKKCDGEKAQKRRFKRLDVRAGDQPPMMVSTQKHNCPAPGHYPFEKQDECSSAFLKCEKTKSGKIRGFVYKCPNQYVYWSVSRKCEPKGKLRNCKDSVNNWSGRWEIPVETKNVAPSLIDEKISKP